MRACTTRSLSSMRAVGRTFSSPPACMRVSTATNEACGRGPYHSSKTVYSGLASIDCHDEHLQGMVGRVRPRDGGKGEAKGWWEDRVHSGRASIECQRADRSYARRSLGISPSLAC